MIIRRVSSMHGLGGMLVAWVAMWQLLASPPHVMGQPVIFDGHPDCMDLPGLRTAVEAAQWKRPSGSDPNNPLPELSAVIITVCDRHCLERLFKLWINSIRFARGGDLTPHVIVISMGQGAYDLCTHFQQDYQHHCVLDRACGYPDDFRSPEKLRHDHTVKEAISFGSRGYKLAMMSKLWWARQVLIMNVAALWVDMDIVVYKALLPRLVTGAVAHSDFLIADEECTANQQLGEEFDLWDTSVRKYYWNENGGLWLVRPTPAGRGLMDVWAARYAATMAEEYVTLDQFIIRIILNENTTTIPSYKMNGDGTYSVIQDPVTGQPVNVTRPLDGQWHKLNQAWYNSLCPGMCGCLPAGYLQSNQPPCEGVPQPIFDRWVTFHMNCLSGTSHKEARMKQLLNVGQLGMTPEQLARSPRSYTYDYVAEQQAAEHARLQAQKMQAQEIQAQEMQALEMQAQGRRRSRRSQL